MKEGIYEDQTNREKILEIARFNTTKSSELRSLSQVVSDMKEGQDTIYYITGENLELVRQSPQLEGFRSRDVEVLLMSDPVDEFWIPAIEKFEESGASSWGVEVRDLVQNLICKIRVPKNTEMSTGG